MNQLRKHELPKRRVAARLRRLGLEVKTQPKGSSFDFLVNGRVRLALKVALPHRTIHRVVSRGRKYTYRYRTWHFNFHRHGRLDRCYADFVVCVAYEARRRGRHEAYVIPWDAITGKTFALHDSRKGPYVGRYAKFRNAWGLVADAATRQIAAVA